MEILEKTQKKKVIFNLILAAIIGLLIIGCALTISLVTSGGKDEVVKAPVVNKPNLNVGEDVQVAVTTYVVPMENATIAKDYSATELQYNETLKQWEIHKAIDFLAGDNLNVYAVTDGTVSKVYNNYLEGTVVEITHKNGLVSVYKSLSNANVAVGDKVSAGQTIGTVGDTMAQELNVGAHLHFEMLENGIKINPSNYLDLGSK